MGKSSYRILIRALFTSYILTALFLLLLAFGLYRFHLTEPQVEIGINIIYVLSCFISGIVAGKLSRFKRFLWGLAAGACYFLILLGTSFLIKKQIGTSPRELILIFAMCAGSGTIGLSLIHI